MITTKINVDNLVRQLLPAHKRQAARMALLRAFLAPLAMLWAMFDLWRSQVRVLLNVASQVGILEGYLRQKYNTDAIKIITTDSGAVRVGLIPEGDLYRLNVGMVGEAAPVVAVPLIGELDDSLGGVDFVVYVPRGVDIEHVRADIERFRLALVTYRIQQGDGYMTATDRQGRPLWDNQGRELLIFKKR